MLGKIIVVLTVASVASAGVGPVAYAAGPLGYAAPAIAHKVHAAPLGYAAPLAKAVVATEDFDYNPQYSYGYSVQDGLTGDAKGHQETRNGDAVQGQYSLVEPDGAIRTVTYTADDLHGFNAVVDRQAPGVVKTAAVVAAPVAKVHAAPLAYAAHGHAPLVRAF